MIAQAQLALPFIDLPRAELRSSWHGDRVQMETYVPVCCPACGGERWLRLYDARRAAARSSPCKSCASSAAGAAGWAATLRKHPGMKEFLVRAAASARRAKPTTLEQAVILLLLDLGVPAKNIIREAIYQTKASRARRRFYVADFQVKWRGQTSVIEVDGAYWHSDPDARRRDRSKRAFFTRRGIPLLRLSESDIRAGRAESLLQTFLQIG